jgi:purine-binding chemotaxis protein CheW
MHNRYGVFFLGGMQLALDLDALCEVVPGTDMVPVPSGAPGVIGAIDLRGTLLPVVDLRRMLGLDVTTETVGRPSVVVLAHADRLLGLLAHATGGVFDCAPERFRKIDFKPGLGVLAGGFARPDDDSLVSVLSPEAILALPGIPSVHGVRAGVVRDTAVQDENRQHTMLFRCAGLSMALRSDVVFTTLLKPAIKDSPVANGYCLGVLEYGGLSLPAVDLARLCGLKHRDAACTQAFLVRYPDGLLAFMVDEILDVVNLAAGSAVPIPDTALHLSDFFSGMLPLDTLPESVRERVDDAQGYLLALSAEHLTGFGQLKALSGVIVPAAAGGQTVVLPELNRDSSQGERRQVLTYDLGFEAVTPIDQFVEIMPWSNAMIPLSEGDTSRGLIMHHGRAIPVFCLSALLGLTVPPLSATASILVVESEGRHVGFIVSRLFTIDDAPAARLDMRAVREDAASILSSRYRECWTRIMIGTGANERMRGVLDLVRVAGTLVTATADAA